MSFRGIRFSSFSIIVISLVLLGWATSYALPKTTPGSVATKRLLTLLNNFTSLEAQFEQSLVLDTGKRVLERSTGRVLVARPNRFKWEILTPHRQVMLLNQGEVLIYDPDLSQVVKRRVDYTNPSNPAMLLSCPLSKIHPAFKIQSRATLDPAVELFILTPKTANSGYQQLQLQFKQGILHRLEIKNSLAQTAQVKFSAMKLGKKLSAREFTLKFPAEVDVIDERQ